MRHSAIFTTVMHISFQARKTDAQNVLAEQTISHDHQNAHWKHEQRILEEIEGLTSDRFIRPDPENGAAFERQRHVADNDSKSTANEKCWHSTAIWLDVCLFHNLQKELDEDDEDG